MTKQTTPTDVEDKDKLSVPLDDWRERFENLNDGKAPSYEQVVAFIATELDRREEEVDERWIYHPAKTIDARIRADERAKILALLVDEEYPITDPDSIDYGKMLAHPKNEWNEELRTAIEQMGEVK
jgi:hypothetical protein